MKSRRMSPSTADVPLSKGGLCPACAAQGAAMKPARPTWRTGGMQSKEWVAMRMDISELTRGCLGVS